MCAYKIKLNDPHILKYFLNDFRLERILWENKHHTILSITKKKDSLKIWFKI